MTSTATTASRRGARLTAGIRWRALIAPAVLAALAYIPALRSSPGRMPADSKLYLYLDPGRFLGDAAASFDPRQFAGWVPHQHIAYLWPAGPYYWFADTIGIPDWIAHRLWIGSIMFAAGLGMWWCARRFGFGIGPALAGAVVYQSSLYILPYISRTSVMLLPWAGLGWIVGLTVQATRTAPDITSRRQRWRAPALIALVVLTVGAVNATALAMITPAPLLWLVYWTARGGRWQSAVGIALRTGVACLAVSVWWMAMLVIQGRYGAEVLPFSETLQDVSFTSTAPEVWRGLGYWLFYIRDFAGPTTTESLIYLVSGTAIIVSFAIPVAGLAGLVLTNWAERRFAWLLIGVGGVLAVGVFPFESPSPLMAFLTGNGTSGLALALRSSTRAVPVMMIGVALGIAALCEAVPAGIGELLGQRDGRTDDDRRVSRQWQLVSPRTVAAAAVVVVALVNTPSLRHARLVDPMLERDEQPPQEWTDAAASISGSGSTSGRVLQVPGIEFGAYRWGFTVDQPVPGLADKPLVTRDLLPLGSAAAMDVLYALDDRVQDGTATTAQFNAAAHALGVDTVWLTGDLAFDRFNTARPVDIRATVEPLGTITEFGAPRINTPRIVWSDERSLERPQSPIPPVELIALDRPSSIVRVAADLTAVSGSGDAIVTSMAVAELAQSSAVVYTADRGPDPLENVSALVITDSNRNRNRQWRSSHDSVGATLTATDPISSVDREQRLPVFENTSPDTQTVAVHDGPMTAFADRYGEPFGYQPEHRAVMAIDGDPTTAWTVGEHGDPVGATLFLDPSEQVQTLELYQYLPIPGQRRISQVRIGWEPTPISRHPDDPPPTTEMIVDIAPTPPDSATTVQLPPDATGPIEIEITAVEGGAPLTEGIVADVGFTEVVAIAGGQRLEPTVEWIRTPVDAVKAVTPQLPVAYSLQRERVDPLNPWRSDPELTMRRIVTVGASDNFRLHPEVRVNPDLADRELAALFGTEVWASNRLSGSLINWGAAALDHNPDTTWISAFGRGDGTVLHLGRFDEPISGLTLSQPFATLSQITAVTVASGQAKHTLRITPDQHGDASIVLDPPLPPGQLTITVTEIEPATTIDRRFGDLRELPVAIGEIGLSGATGNAVDGRGVGSSIAASTVVSECVDLVAIDNTMYRARLRPSSNALSDRAVEAEMCDETVELDAGEHRIESAVSAEFQLDALELRNPTFERVVKQTGDRAPAQIPSVVDVAGSRYTRDITLDDCVEGCWLILGEGYNPGWTAEIDGRSLGPPTLVDGTSNGWWVPKEWTDDGAVTARVHWTEQRTLTLALWFSLVAVLACVAIAATTNRSPTPAAATVRFVAPWRFQLARRAAMLTGVGIVGVCFLLVGLEMLWFGIVIAALVATTRRLWPLTIAPPLLVVVSAVSIARSESLHRYTPDALWPRQFSDLHSVAMLAFALAIVSGLIPAVAKRRSSDSAD